MALLVAPGCRSRALVSPCRPVALLATRAAAPCACDAARHWRCAGARRLCAAALRQPTGCAAWWRGFSCRSIPFGSAKEDGPGACASRAVGLRGRRLSWSYDLGGCASPPLRCATVRCSVDECKAETCHSKTVRCADDKHTLTCVKVGQRFRLRGATSLRVRWQSASPSSVGSGPGAVCACGASASPRRSSRRARARSGSRR